MAIVVATLVGLGFLGSEAIGQEQYKWQFATYAPPSHVAVEAVQAWVNDVNALIKEHGNSEISVRFFYSESLLKASEIMHGVADGRADMGFMAAQYHPAELPLAQITGIPFLTRNSEAQAKAIYELYQENEEFRNEFHRNGIHLISVAPLSSNIVVSTRSIRNLKDFSGSRMRVVGYSRQAFEALGVTTVAVTQPEVYESLQRGVLDTSSSVTLDIAADFNYHEIAKFWIDPGIGVYALTMNVMNLELWQKLPDSIKEAMAKRSAEDAQKASALLSVREANACETAKKAGVQVTILSDDDVSQWAQKVGALTTKAWIEHAKSAGAKNPEAFLEQYVAAIRKYEAQSSYKPGTLACADKK